MAYKDPQDPRMKMARIKHYRNNRQLYYDNNKRKKRRMSDYIIEKKNVPCMDCGNRFPSFVMDFHHRDMNTKDGNIRTLIGRQSWRILIAEIEKCDIICANCHRIRSAKELKYYIPEGK